MKAQFFPCLPLLSVLIELRVISMNIFEFKKYNYLLNYMSILESRHYPTLLVL